ncbi:MAG: FGGY-family carbohydrate kinase [Spirochaetaceae bacterium]|nr:MAG: FGGY-family carbohydrate kinase [Spirochaetaceae bacterium]
MARRYVLGVDSSTTSCKVIAWDHQGRAAAVGRAFYPTHSPRPGWYEQDAGLWWSSLCRALGELFSRLSPSQVEAVCISNQRETIVAVDSEGVPLREAILWLDERSREQLGYIHGTVGRERLHRLTGKPLSKVPSLPKLLWMAAVEPEIFSRTAKFLEAHAFLVHRLTGEYRTSLACADPVGLVDMSREQWSEELLQELGFRKDQFSQLVKPGEIIGRVTSSAATQTGLPQGLPVVAGAGDGQCAGLGANVTGPETAYLILGTGVIGGFFSSEYRIDPAYRTLYAPLADSYYLETVIKGGVFTVAWFAEKFAAELKKPWLSSSVEELLEQGARGVPPGSDGLLLVPYWLSAMNPFWDPDAAGVMIGWSGAHGPEHFYRAILEGVAFEQRFALDEALRAGVEDFEEYRVVGGGSRSELWCQIVADISGRPAVTLSSAEATALGAGMLAAVAVGWYPDCRKSAAAMSAPGMRYAPDGERRRIYERIFLEVYRSLFSTVRPLVDRLREITREGNSGA